MLCEKVCAACIVLSFFCKSEGDTEAEKPFSDLTGGGGRLGRARVFFKVEGGVAAVCLGAAVEGPSLVEERSFSFQKLNAFWLVSINFFTVSLRSRRQLNHPPARPQHALYLVLERGKGNLSNMFDSPPVPEAVDLCQSGR